MQTLLRSTLLTSMATALLLAGAAAPPFSSVLAAPSASSVAADLPTATSPQLSVTGQGRATAKPDVAFLSLGVQTQATSAKDALASNASAMSTVIAQIKAQGVADNDIQTSGISLNPVVDQPKPNDNRPPKVVAYNVTNTVEVTVRAIANVGPVLDAAVSAGATSAGGVRFGIADPSGVQHQAMEAAVNDARANANVIAAAAGVKITRIQSISVEQASVPVPRQEAAFAASPAPTTPVQTGELTVVSQVNVVYLIG